MSVYMMDMKYNQAAHGNSLAVGLMGVRCQSILSHRLCDE